MSFLAKHIQVYQWIVVVGFSLFLYFVSPFAKTITSFFEGKSETNKRPGFWMLTSSLVISWIFAKSITNAANLGEEFGFIGGLSYAAYYGSFMVAGWVIYRMRTKGAFKSIHQFLNSKYGRPAVIIFSLVIAFRLFNEVWSNTEVIGTYFGPRNSIPYIASIAVFTILTLAYSLKGGFRSSLVTDVIQMALFVVLLFIVLEVIVPKVGSIKPFVESGKWSMSTGLNLFFAAVIQMFSYPFHDPVLTDRGFISDESTTLKSFVASTFIGFACILLFSFVGIYAARMGFTGDAAVAVSRSFGAGIMLVMNVIMVTSAASTLDSTFSSVAKLSVVDIAPDRLPRLNKGRWAMIIITILGSMPLFLSPKIISATTISGTMVIGLAPIFLFWYVEAPPVSFYLSMAAGVLSGLVLTFGLLPTSLMLTSGPYADLLSINIYGTILCFLGFFLPVIIQRKRQVAIES